MRRFLVPAAALLVSAVEAQTGTRLQIVEGPGLENSTEFTAADVARVR